MPDKVRVGMIGTGFVAEVHATSITGGETGCVLTGVASPTPGRLNDFADRFKVPFKTQDYRELLARDDVDMVILALPNYLHSQATIDAARAGKHVVCEKPLCVTLDEADRMIAEARDAGVLLMYAEELCFTPKYLRVKQLVDEGALGKVYMVKQSEKHFGPHSPWFWDIERSGGGVLLDMGCHGIEFARWMLGKPDIKSVYCQAGTHVHADRTRGDDNSILIVEFDGGAVGLIEDSWAKRGGMDDRSEVYGEGGVAYADLLMGNSVLTYSEYGYGYAVEKAPTTKGWTFTAFEELWNYGFPQEMAHFARCVQGLERPVETGEDGRVVMEAIYAAYASAGEGRKISLPFTPPQGVKKPADLWLKTVAGEGR